MEGVGLTHSTLRRENRPHGEGGSDMAYASQETFAGHEGPESGSQPHWGGKARPALGQVGVRTHVISRSPVREFRTPGSVRGRFR